MRANVVSVILFALLATLGVSLWMRPKQPHTGALPRASASTAPSASARPSASAPVVAAPKSSGPLPLTPAKPKPKLGRPLRVVAPGWDLLAPVLLEIERDKGKKDFGGAGLAVEAKAVDDMSAVEGALARGGGDESGADVALMPLPALVASYDKLRALDPVVFFVTGWSAGREILTGPTLSQLPAKGELVVDSGKTPSSTLLALFCLDQSGVAPERIKLDGEKPELVAVSHEQDKGDDAVKQTSVLVSTADASRLIPFVAIAPRSLLEKNSGALLGWVKGWVAGQKKLSSDPPSAARSIAALKDAPEPIALLARLGELSPASLYESAELFGLSGRGAVTLSSLLTETWKLWRAASLTNAPPPESMPVDGRIVAGLVRADPELAAPPERAADKKSEGAPKTGAVLLVRRLRGATLDEDAALEAIGFLAGIFPRSPLRVTVHRGGAAASKSLAGRAVDRFGLTPDRVTAGKLAPKPGTIVSIEVLSVP